MAKAINDYLVVRQAIPRRVGRWYLVMSIGGMPWSSVIGTWLVCGFVLLLVGAAALTFSQGRAMGFSAVASLVLFACVNSDGFGLGALVVFAVMGVGLGCIVLAGPWNPFTETLAEVVGEGEFKRMMTVSRWLVPVPVLVRGRWAMFGSLGRGDR
jgi:hypothetical protein